MNIFDSFRILGLPKNACVNDLKLAYRQKAKRFHPDRKGGNSKQFALLHEAYTFLLDCGLLDSREDLNGAAREAERKAAEQKVAEKKAAERKAAEQKAIREAERKAAEKKALQEASLQEAERIAAEKKAVQEAERKSAIEKALHEAERKAARRTLLVADRDDLHKEYHLESKNQLSTSKQLFTAGEILKSAYSVEEKISAIETFIELKRKSAYPFLRTALYDSSERVVLASVEAIGKLKIIQASPELGSLMSMGSIRVRSTILDTVERIGKKSNYLSIIELALEDEDPAIRQKAERIIKRIYE